MDITVLRQLSLGLIWVAPDTTLDTQKWPAAAPNVNQYTAPSPLPGRGGQGLQGYLVHKKQPPPPKDHHMTLVIVLL